MHTRPGILGACLLALLLCGAALAQNPDLQVDWEYTDSGGNLVSGTITISDGATEPLVVEQSELGGTTVTWVLTGVDPTGNDLFPDVGYAVPPNPAGFRDGGFFNLGGPVNLEYTVTADPLNPGDPTRVSTCTLAVTVEDTTGPVIASVDCESVPDPVITVTDGDIAAFDDSAAGGRVVDFTANVTDLCDANPTVTYNPASGSTFTVGDTTVTATATDASGNSSQIQFTIRINSLTGPNAPIMVPEPTYSEGPDNEVAWTITDPATEFTEVQVSDDPTFGTVLDAYRTNWTGADPETHTFAGLSDAVEYFYRGRAGVADPFGNDVWGAWSGSTSSTQDNQAPAIVGTDMVIEQEALAGTVITGATWHQTTQADWMSDALTDVDVATLPGDVILDTVSAPNIDTIGSGSLTTAATPGGVALNYFQAAGDSLLTQIEHWIDTTTDQEVEFAVYESATIGGPYTSVYSDLIIIDAIGPAFYSSGPISVPIQDGLYYAIGISFTAGDVRYDDTAPGAFGIGNWVGDLGLPLPGIPSPLLGPDGTTTPHYGRLTTIDSYFPTGTIEGTVINPFPAVQQWGTLRYDSETPGDSILTVDVLDGAGTVLLADVASGDDLGASGVDATTNPQINLRATLETPSGTYTPVLSSWTVEYDNGNPFGVYATDTVDPDYPVSVGDGTGKLTGVRSDGQLVTDPFPLGNTTVTWTAQDHFGPNFGAENPAAHTTVWVQTVTVEDTTAPDITAIPGAGAVASGPDLWLVEQLDPSGAPVNYTYAATDRCDVSPVITATPPPGTTLNLGDHLLQITATDASGNEVSRVITVRVQDTTAPEAVAAGSIPADIVIYQPNPTHLQPYTWADVQRGLQYRLGINDLPALAPSDVYDACDPNPTIVGHNAAGLGFSIGRNRISWTVVDASGNTGQVFQYLVIEPLAPPPGGGTH